MQDLAHTQPLVAMLDHVLGQILHAVEQFQDDTAFSALHVLELGVLSQAYIAIRQGREETQYVGGSTHEALESDGVLIAIEKTSHIGGNLFVLDLWDFERGFVVPISLLY